MPYVVPHAAKDLTLMTKIYDKDSVREGERRPMVLRSLIFATGGVAILAFVIYFVVIGSHPG